MSEDRLSAELLKLLGERDFLRLIEAFAGTRLFVPAAGDKRADAVIQKLGRRALTILSERYAGDQIRVPLARAFRAVQYRAFGKSNAEIARSLGITEPGVNKLFKRMPSKPQKGSRDPRQIDLFLES